MEMADGGTVSLDEIGDMSWPLQATLLRVLQDREFQRVGGTKTVSVNIRIIAATNTDLKQAVVDGDFREDLFFRLSVISLVLPPPRERRQDIPALAKLFLNRHTKEAIPPDMLFSAGAMETMTQYSWPDNIRELENVIARAVVLSHTETIEPEMLALDARDHPGWGPTLPYLDVPSHESLEAHSRSILGRALDNADGNQTTAADRLHLPRTYLARLTKQ